MKRKRESLFLRLEEPTEESVFADFEELLLGAWANMRNFSTGDVVALAKGYFGPAVRADLSRAKLVNNSLGEANRKRVRKAEQRRRDALVVAARLLRETKSLRLPRKKSQLARRMHTELAKNGGKPPPQRTIRRWLDEIFPLKKYRLLH